jgi:hypothetical protein
MRSFVPPVSVHYDRSEKRNKHGVQDAIVNCSSVMACDSHNARTCPTWRAYTRRVFGLRMVAVKNSRKPSVIAALAAMIAGSAGGNCARGACIICPSAAALVDRVHSPLSRHYYRDARKAPEVGRIEGQKMRHCMNKHNSDKSGIVNLPS